MWPRDRRRSTSKQWSTHEPYIPMKNTNVIVLALALGLWATPVQADDGPRLHIALTAYMAAHGADLYTTGYCIGARTCREVNPVFAPFAHQPVAFGATKMGKWCE